MERSRGIIPVYFDGRRWRVLLIQNRGGSWGFPKGHVEGNETDVETARRELWEEAGMKTAQIVYEPVFEEQYQIGPTGKRVSKHVKYFLGRVQSTKVRRHPVEVIDSHWFDFSSAYRVLEYTEIGRILRLAQHQVITRRVFAVTKSKK